MFRRDRIGFSLMLFVFIVPIIYIYYDNGVFESIHRYFSSTEIRNLFETIAAEEHQSILMHFVTRPFNSIPFDQTIIEGTMLFQILLPFLASASCILFYKKHTTLNKMIYSRTKWYQNTILKEIITTSLRWAFFIFLGYFLFYMIVVLNAPAPTINSNNIIPRTIFLDIFGESFYYDYPRFYWLLEGFLRFYLVPFVYSFIACTLSVVLNSGKKAYLFTNGYYISFSALMAALGQFNLPFNLTLYLNPSVIMASGSYNLYTIPLLLALLLPCFLVAGYLCYNRRILYD